MNTDENKIFVSDLSYDKDELEAVSDVIKSQWLTMGPRTNKFEEALADYVHSQSAVAVSNGTAALHLALVALGVGPGDEVIVTPLSFVASSNAVFYTGARPVFADVDPDTFNICPDQIEKKITQKTKAILPVHLAGCPADMESIQKIAKEYDLKVLEDAAHAIGAEYKGTRVGAIGDATAFSFFSNKNLSVGEGGAITTNDQELAANLKLLRSHGLTKSTWSRHYKKDEESYDQLYDMVVLGFNYRMTEISAALGHVQLQKLDSFNTRRRELYYRYRDLMEGLPLQFQHIDQEVKSSYHVLPVLFPEGTRPRIRVEFEKSGIGTSIHYTPIHKFTYYKENGYGDVSMPVAEEIGRRVITLPLHQNLKDEDVDRVAKLTKSLLLS